MHPLASLTDSFVPFVVFCFADVRGIGQCFMPQKAVHDAKKKKIVNCGVVAFTLDRCAIFSWVDRRLEDKPDLVRKLRRLAFWNRWLNHRSAN